MATTNALAHVPEDRNMGHVLVVTIAVLVIFTIVTTALRLWTRGKCDRLGWDDYTIAICCLLAVARTIIQFVSVGYGNGRHKVYITPENYEYINFLGYITQVLLFINIGLLKCSICILILRIRESPRTKWFLYTMMAGLVLTNSACVLILLAQCSPVKKYWIPTAPGTCWDVRFRIYSIYIQVAYSIATDFICALLPVFIIWNSRIVRSLKLAICGLMSLGLVATACAIVRATSLNTRVIDISYEYCIASIWASTELHLGIIATNLSLSRSISRYLFSDGRPSYFRKQRTKADSTFGGHGSSSLSWLASTEKDVRTESCQCEPSPQMVEHTGSHSEEGMGNNNSTMGLVRELNGEVGISEARNQQLRKKGVTTC